MKRHIHFVARYELEEYDSSRFYVLAAASREYQNLEYDRDVVDAVCRVADEADYFFQRTVSLGNRP